MSQNNAKSVNKALKLARRHKIATIYPAIKPLQNAFVCTVTKKQLLLSTLYCTSACKLLIYLLFSDCNSGFFLPAEVQEKN